MRRFTKQLIPARILEFRESWLWKARQYAPPSPPHIKRQVLLRNGIPNSTWIETGTFEGDTSLFLSFHAKKVISIEPEPNLFARAKARLSARPNIELINGLSENSLPELLSKLDGDVNFWLDGHFSAGVTYKGPKDTPIEEELNCIQRYLNRFLRAVVLIDDVRCFNPSLEVYAGYPALDALVDWARRNKLAWHIEHDIFVARKD